MAHVIRFRTAKFDVSKERTNPINPIPDESLPFWLRNPTVAKILLMRRCNIKLHAYFLPDQTRRKEFIVGSVLDCAVEMDQSHMDKGLINHLIENFLQR